MPCQRGSALIASAMDSSRTTFVTFNSPVNGKMGPINNTIWHLFVRWKPGETGSASILGWVASVTQSTRWIQTPLWLSRLARWRINCNDPGASRQFGFLGYNREVSSWSRSLSPSWWLFSFYILVSLYFYNREVTSSHRILLPIWPLFSFYILVSLVTTGRSPVDPGACRQFGGFSVSTYWFSFIEERRKSVTVFFQKK